MANKLFLEMKLKKQLGFGLETFILIYKFNVPIVEYIYKNEIKKIKLFFATYIQMYTLFIYKPESQNFFDPGVAKS